MTVVFERNSAGPSVHALVIGVGTYPHAKVEREGIPAALWSVADIPGAVAGAKLFCDWLVANGDGLPAPLGSVEMLLSDPAGAASHAWSVGPDAAMGPAACDPRGGGTSVEPATLAATLAAGERWAQRFAGVGQGHFAVLYVCGHGLATTTRSIVFLEDLCAMAATHSPWHPFLDVQALANRMATATGVEAGYVFVDACQQSLEAFILADADPTDSEQSLCPIFPRRVAMPKRNVLLMVPGPMGSLAFDDGVGGGGRFTKALVRALEGAAARSVAGMGEWEVPIDTLADKVRQVDRLATRDAAVSPQVATMPSGIPSLMRFAGAAPVLPLRMRTDPEPAMRDATGVWIEDHLGVTVVQKTCAEAVWTTEVQARLGLFRGRASFPDGRTTDPAGGPAVDLSEMHVDPPLLLRVSP